MSLQLIIVICTVLAFAAFAFMFNRSIKKYDARPKTRKQQKKGRTKYMQQAKNPGR